MLRCGGGKAKFAGMEIARTLPSLRRACAALRTARGALALVPTMGALHAGHLALVKAALDSGAAVVTSIFVNPLQFGANEDLSRYPRDETADLAMLREAGCDLVWLPDVATMYPAGSVTTIEVTGPSELWEGVSRPGHFRGVATVCAKLFGQVRPDRAYFGEKDWQQLQVVTRMVTDLLLPLQIVGVPTVREASGLALSSRNRFLTDDARRLAPRLYATLQACADELARGTQADPVLDEARSNLTNSGFDVDYLALVDGRSMSSLQAVQAEARLIAAANVGPVRLIDNIAALPQA